MYHATILCVGPGGERVLTLTIDDAYYYATFSSPLDELLAGERIYVQVDSASADSDAGAVLEMQELLGEPYSNVSGPHRGEDVWRRMRSRIFI